MHLARAVRCVAKHAEHLAQASALAALDVAAFDEDRVQHAEATRYCVVVLGHHLDTHRDQIGGGHSCTMLAAATMTAAGAPLEKCIE